MIEVNSEEYWNRRFRGDWDNNDGDKQSLFFANQAIEMFPGWLRGILENGGKTFCDWGCAEGDGTDLLAKTYTKTYFEQCNHHEVRDNHRLKFCRDPLKMKLKIHNH